MKNDEEVNYSSSAVAKIRGFVNKIIRTIFIHSEIFAVVLGQHILTFQSLTVRVNKLSFKFFLFLYHNIKFVSRTAVQMSGDELRQKSRRPKIRAAHNFYLSLSYGEGVN